tara:strand:- start:3436 stop:3762 length:327 start_codon:yes stop_codon:yes gene_type:complete
MITKTLIPSRAAASETVTGSTFQIHMPKSNRGIVQMTSTSGHTANNITLTLYGRLSSDMDWVEVSGSAITLSAAGTDAVEDIQLFPEMYAKVACATTESTTYIVQLGC